MTGLDSNLPTEQAVREAINTGNSALQTELDGTQTGAGLGADGSYTANAGTNYITTSTSLVDATEDLDVQVDDIITKEEEEAPTQAELDEKAWLEKYNRYVRIKETLIDTGIITGNETKVKNLLADVQAGLKPAYLDSI